MRRTLLYIFSIAMLYATAIGHCYARKRTLKIDMSAIENNKVNMDGAVDSLRTMTGAKAIESVRFYGYDKPYSSNSESVFVMNISSADTLLRMSVEIQYQTVQGTLLHTRLHTFECDVPPASSQRLLFPTWDKTHTFYYYMNKPARKQNLSPYKVLITPVQLWYR